MRHSSYCDILHSTTFFVRRHFSYCDILRHKVNSIAWLYRKAQPKDSIIYITFFILQLSSYCIIFILRHSSYCDSSYVSTLHTATLFILLHLHTATSSYCDIFILRHFILQHLHIATFFILRLFILRHSSYCDSSYCDILHLRLFIRRHFSYVGTLHTATRYHTAALSPCLSYKFIISFHSSSPSYC